MSYVTNDQNIIKTATSATNMCLDDYCRANNLLTTNFGHAHYNELYPRPSWKKDTNEDSWTYWWSYSGPANWGVLNGDWFLCDKGKKQSPINIDTSKLLYDATLESLNVVKLLTTSPQNNVTNNLRIAAFLENNGHSISLNFSRLASSQTEWIEVAQGLNNGQEVSTDTNHLNKNEPTNLINEANSLFKSFDAPKVPQTINLADIPYHHQTENITQQNYITDEHYHQQQKAFSDTVTKTKGPAYIVFSKAGLAYKYTLDSASLRFGASDSRPGSEHHINNVAFDAELQFLAFNSLLYKSVHEASSKQYGLLGISVLIRSSNSNSSSKPNDILELVAAQKERIKYRNHEQVLLDDIDVSMLLPDVENFVTYDGSMTIPPCSESITWIVLNKPLFMNQKSVSTRVIRFLCDWLERGLLSLGKDNNLICKV